MQSVFLGVSGCLCVVIIRPRHRRRALLGHFPEELRSSLPTEHLQEAPLHTANERHLVHGTDLHATATFDRAILRSLGSDKHLEPSLGH